MDQLECLVLGGSGQVGTALRRLARPGNLQLHFPSRAELDLADHAALREIIGSRRWACVINAAAFTSVDAAESEGSTAWQLNAVAPGQLSEATARANVPLLHLSTDYVFDGSQEGPYCPLDPVHPINFYGASKAAGENAIRCGNPRHVILRTSWVISPFGANFVKTILRLADKQPVLKVVDDQRGRPTSAADLAETVQTIAARLALDPGTPSGTYHFANAGTATWHDVASAVLARAQERGIGVPALEAISARDYRAPARRPANSVLCTQSLERDFGITPRHWRDALDDILDLVLPPALPLMPESRIRPSAYAKTP
jgi:dTDP-4-dehydrorhamnose reductase